MIQRPQEPTAARLLKWPPPESQLSLETGKEDLKRWMKHLQWHNQISMIFWLFLKNSGTSITDVVWHTIYCTRCIWHRSRATPVSILPIVHLCSGRHTSAWGAPWNFAKKWLVQVHPLRKRLTWEDIDTSNDCYILNVWLVRTYDWYGRFGFSLLPLVVRWKSETEVQTREMLMFSYASVHNLLAGSRILLIPIRTWTPIAATDKTRS